MKRSLIIAIAFILITGCASKKIFCPRERAYFLDPDGQVIVMEKGFFDKKEGHWITEDEFNLIVEKYKKQRGY